MNAFGKKMLQFGLICLVIWVGFNKIKENWPQPSPEEIAAQQKQSAEEKKSELKDEEFILQPGQGRKITSNYRRVRCKVTGPCLVRERDGAWFGKWKKDGPGKETDFDFSEAKEIEYWVPKNFPGQVAIIVRR